HWSEPIEGDRLSAKGYTTQAFTHGTLGCADADAYGKFVEEVLGLEVHRAYANVRYFKSPAAKHFLVALQVPEPSAFSPNFRFTLTLESPDAVEQAHTELAAQPNEVGLTEVSQLATDGDSASFTVRDLNGNWWELASPSPTA